MEQVSCCFITVVYPGLDKLPYGEEGNDILPGCIYMIDERDGSCISLVDHDVSCRVDQTIFRIV